MTVEFSELISEYGYAAAFVGTLIEGESFLLLAGVAAHRGYLSMPILLAIGALGAFLSDNVFFVVGRVFGPSLLDRFPRFAPSAARAHALIARLPITAVIGIRFLYGMRSAGPALIGAGRMSWGLFAMLDALAAALWSGCWTSVGYAIGEGVSRLLRQSGQIGPVVLIGVATAIVIGGLALRRVRRRAANPPALKQ